MTITKIVSIFGVALLLILTGDLALSEPFQEPELERYFAKLEQLTREEGEIPLSGSKFAQEIKRSRNYAEQGKYKEAATVLSALLEEEMMPHWRESLTTRLEILKKWDETKTIELSDYRRFYLGLGPAWFQERIKPIVTLWKFNDVDEKQKYVILRELLRSRKDGVGERLILQAIASSKNSTNDEAANALFELGFLHYQLEEYDQAIAVWLQVRGQFPDSTAWGIAVFYLGILHKERGDFSQAIGNFSLLVDAKVVDWEPVGRLLETYLNYRPPWPQREIGNCFFAQKNYQEALKAYRQAEAKDPVGWWGHADPTRHPFYQGLCHDWLGDQHTAVKLYYRGIRRLGDYPCAFEHLRFVDIYEAAGQSKDLQQLLDSIDKQHLIETKQSLESDDLRSDDEILKRSPSQRMRRILAIRSMESKEDWDGLISLLRLKGSGAGPANAHSRLVYWELVEASRLLAKHSKETVPLIIARFAESERDDVKWLYYALGCCGSEEALQTLKTYALRETNGNWTSAVVYSISIAGEKGEVTLKELEKLADGNLQYSIQRYRKGKLGDQEEDVHFPKLNDIPTLPRTLEELKIF